MKRKIIWGALMIGITFLIYYASFNSFYQSYLFWYLYLIPIIIFSYSYGTKAGLINAGTAVILLVPELVIEVVRYYGTFEIVYPLSIPVIFLCAVPLAVDLPRAQRIMKRQVEEYEVIETLSRRLNSTFGFHKNVDSVLEKIISMTGADRGFIAAPAFENDELSILSSDKYDEEEQKALNSKNVEEYIKTNMIRGKADTAKKALPGVSSSSQLAAALEVSGETRGLIYLESRRKNAFAESDVYFAKRMAGSISGALENSFLYETVRSKAAETSILLDTSKVISSTLDIETVLQLISEKLVLYLKVTFCSLYLLTDGREKLIKKADYHIVKGHRKINGEEVPLHEMMIFKEALENEELVIFSMWEEYKTHEGFPNETELEKSGLENVQSLILLPLKSKEQILGLIVLGERRSPERSPITKDKITLCKALASQAAMAVENALMHEAELNKRKYYKVLFDSIKDAIITVDTERNIKYLNPAAEALLGVDAGEAVGQVCSDFLDHGCTGECPLHEMNREDFKKAVVKKRVLKVGDKEIPVLQSIAPLIGEMGKVRGAVSVIHDITAEEKLNEMKSDFVSMVSHELRAPLAGMKASLEVLLEDEFESPIQRKLIEKAHQRNERLVGLINDILDVSALQSGRLVLNKEPLPLKPIIESRVKEVQQKWSGHHFETSIESDVFILADKAKIAIILDNLIENAAKYSPEGCGVFIRAKKFASGQVGIYVKDEGEGISPEHKSKIFERFYRANDNHANGGHGLGLYITRALVEAHGGRVWVSSRPKKGTMFCFTMPGYEYKVEELDIVE